MPELILDHNQLLELSSEILSQGSSFRFQAAGGSMQPFIRQGDILTVQAVDPAALQVGQVVFYRLPGDRLAAHRVIRLDNGEGLITVRGDAQRGAGEPLRPAQVLGVVVAIQRGARQIKLDTVFWRKTGYLWSLLAPAILYLRSGVDWAATVFIARLTAFKVYRLLAGKWAGKRTTLRHAQGEDSFDLSLLYGYHKNPALESRGFQAVDQDGFILVAHLGDCLAGALTVKKFPSEETRYPGWWLFGMLVRLRYRGTGIGRNLLEQALRECKARGAARVNLLVVERNRAAVSLYTNAGFQPYSIPELEADLETEVRAGQPRRVILSRAVDVSPDHQAGA